MQSIGVIVIGTFICIVWAIMYAWINTDDNDNDKFTY